VAEVVARFQKAVNCFDSPLHTLPEDPWSRATPCAEWDVRMLVNHVVGELAWIPPLVEGKTVADVGDTLSGDLLGADPLGSFHHQAGLAHTALEAPGALERTVHLSFGDTSALDYANQVAGDVLIHSWDLARAVGVDDTLPPELVAWANGWAEGMVAQFGQYGVFAAAVPVPSDADPQTRLLATLGRAR
jgi:uncharacterized protein (TIGR03086 family)